MQELLYEGVILTDDGIVYPGSFYLNRVKRPYESIAMVEFVPFPEDLLLRMRYGPSVSSKMNGAWRAQFSGTVVVEFKEPCLIRYYLFNPLNPLEFSAKLRARVAAKAMAKDALSRRS